MHDRADALCHNHRGRAVEIQTQITAQGRIGLVVKCRGCVVQNQNIRLACKRSCDQQSLLLTTRNIGALAGQHVLEPLGECRDKFLGLRDAHGGGKILLGNLSAKADIFTHRVGIQKIVLHSRTEMRAQLVVRHGAHVFTADINVTLVGIVIAKQQTKQRALTATRCTDNAQRCSARQRERHVLKVVLLAHVGKADVIKHDMVVGGQRQMSVLCAQLLGG